MAQLARFQDSFANQTTGLPVVGAEVSLYREGATADGSSGPNSPTLVVSVHAPGRIKVGNAVFLDNDPDTTYSVTAVAAGSVTLGGLGADLTVSNLQRLIPVSDPPTLFEDDQGAGSGSTPNPLTTDANGRVNCWIETGAYEEIIDVGGTKTLFQGIQIGYDAPATIWSSVFDSATAVAHIFNTRNALATAGAKLLELYNNDVLKFSIDKDGALIGGLTILTGDLTVTAADLAITAGQLTMGAAVSQLVPGSTSFSIRNNADDADNLIITDAGAGTFRDALTVGDDLTVAGDVTVTGATLTALVMTAVPDTETITAGGAISVLSSNMILAANSGTADDLDSLSGGADGTIVILQADAGDTITCRHGVNNLRLSAGASMVLNSAQWSTLMLKKNGTTNTWDELTRSTNA